MKFFELLKTNAILYSILLSGNFSTIDLKELKHVDYFFPTDSGLVIRDYSIGEEHFEDVTIILTQENGTIINFQTKESKYFENPEFYFGKTMEENIKKPYEIDGIKINRSNKI